MKKHLMMLVALLLVVAMAVPALAAVELKYGGQFRTRLQSNNNLFDGTDDIDDNQNYIDQRMRMYFYFVASENLRVVTKFEVGDTTWGGDNYTRRTAPTALGVNIDPATHTHLYNDSTATRNVTRRSRGTTLGASVVPAAHDHTFSVGRVGAGTGGNVGADAVNIETKNVYVEFGIPNTPVIGSVGIQGIALLDAWILDDDFSAAVAKAKFDPVKVELGYIAAQNNDLTDQSENIDSLYLSVEYAGNVGPGALTANLVGFYQYGHQTDVSTFPRDASSPISSPFPVVANIDSNNLFDLGFKLGYKMDLMSAYVSFVKNLGSVEAVVGEDVDYAGWMIDAGASFFCGPFTFNVGGFYTSGQDPDEEDEIGNFTYPLATSKYHSEIIGGGIMDRQDIGTSSGDQWVGYGQPSNLWTATVGASWQALEKTKLSASYWYFGTSEDVITLDDRGFEEANDVGHEFDIYLTQGIVDGLTLDIVGAYLIAGDAYSIAADEDDVYEVGARLQWSF